MKKTKTRIKTMVVWNEVHWPKLERTVFKLQKRIYQATQRGDVKTARKLQKTLLNSWSAKMLATRRVTQDNRGKVTAGIDGKKNFKPTERVSLAENLTLDWKAKATRRIWIPKPGKTEKRPLGIPIISDRAKQVLVKLALEPEWEAKFEPNSYGFRPGRSCMDAIEGIKAAIKQKSKFVLEADIAKCFDKIDRQKLLEKLNTFPKVRRQIKSWLQAGVVDGKSWFPTNEGISQGGGISPLLANIALHGMEKVVKDYARSLPGKKDKNEQQISLIRYAEDFVILHPEIEVIQNCKALIEKFLLEMGLELKAEKTRLTHTLIKVENEEPGFNFLGFNIRQYPVGKYATGKNTHGKPLGYKTYVKPSKEAIKRHYQKISTIVDQLKHSCSQLELIKMLNPIITGWSNYYSKVNSAKIFGKLDHFVTLKLISWATRKSNNKSKKETISKYFKKKGNNNWVFEAEGKEKPVTLRRYRDSKIENFVKVKGTKSPYDGDLIYWAARRGKSVELPVRVTNLLKKQKGKCAECGQYFKDGDFSN
ncbi:MAG: group II intron reverse transcriptase/maturase [Okeania sp. SIO3I5]|uniref:group II intron reverse transcriptase/maturase n=1 Tax=Okeania sp. SIO3I5 TaxID=2607805 RepID=UPI0013B915F5|nr:group II intron reverse transcriptase/maturase [Okeania sp. SIO3I5]